MSASDGLLYQYLLRLSTDELLWQQFVNDEAARRLRRATMTTYGLVIGRAMDGSLDNQWRVTDDDDDGTITIEVTPVYGDRPDMACLIDHEGFVGVLTGALDDVDVTPDLAIPDTSTWYTITAELEATQYEPGTLTLVTGSADIVGVGTNFLLFQGKDDTPEDVGTYLRIDAADSANGNEETYEVLTVVDATHLTLTTPPAGTNETIVNWTIAGHWRDAAPVEPDIHQRRRVKITRQSGIIREPDPGVVPLADVYRNSGNTPEIAIIDRRHQRLYRTAAPFGGQQTSIPALMLDYRPGTYITATSPRVRVQAVDTTGTVLSNAVCPAGAGGTLMLTQIATTIAAFREDVATANNSGTGLADVPYLVTTGGSFSGIFPSLARLPPESGYTHIVTFVDGVVLKCRRSADDGDTWGAAVTILDPTGNNPADLISHSSVILLTNGRIHVVYDYALGGTAYQLYGANSDDFGATWDVDAGFGYLVKGTFGVDAQHPKVAQYADGRLVVVHLVDLEDIGMTTSTDPSGEWSDASGVATDVVYSHTAWSHGGATADLKSPALWLSPQGMAVVLYRAYYSLGGRTDGFIRYLVIGSQPVEGVATPYVMRDCPLWYTDGGATSALDVEMSVAQDGAGQLALAWTNSQDSYHAYFTRLLIVDQPYQEGGANRYRL
mgnify:CR=1 FL=1